MDLQLLSLQRNHLCRSDMRWKRGNCKGRKINAENRKIVSLILTAYNYAISKLVSAIEKNMDVGTPIARASVPKGRQ